MCVCVCGEGGGVSRKMRCVCVCVRACMRALHAYRYECQFGFLLYELLTVIAVVIFCLRVSRWIEFLFEFCTALQALFLC